MKMNKCYVCGKPFKDGDDVIPILKYVVNERHGDFVSQEHKLLHATHLK